jgi:uncharacterized protein (TIGR02452 family)
MDAMDKLMDKLMDDHLDNQLDNHLDDIFTKRVDCWKNTLHISTYLLPLPPPSLKIKYADTFPTSKRYEKSNIKFFDMDAIDCCLVHAPNALVLNLADDNFPGGCVSVGSGAQEEALFRRTNYCSSLKIELYPIQKDEIIYSPNISVIKTNEKKEWKLVDIHSCPKVSFIACPGIRYPDTIIVDNEIQLQESDVDILQKKIITIIQTAITFKYETIVFGALGCGAWRNPSKHVAQIMKEVLGDYDGCVPNFYFAIMNTTDENYIVRNHNKDPIKTIDIFKAVFT